MCAGALSKNVEGIKIILIKFIFIWTRRKPKNLWTRELFFFVLTRRSILYVGERWEREKCFI